MKLKEAIRADKRVTSDSGWHRQQKMPRTRFPLSRSNSYMIPASWDAWRVVEFTARRREFRLLIAFDVSREEYRAWLGIVRGQDTVLLARLEFHGSHAGWHCHANCDDPANRRSGIVKGLGDRRYPRVRSFHRRTQFGISEVNALAFAYRFFHIKPSATRPSDGMI